MTTRGRVARVRRPACGVVALTVVGAVAVAAFAAGKPSPASGPDASTFADVARAPTGGGAGLMAAAQTRVTRGFEANAGQAVPEVSYLSRGSHDTLFLSGSEAVIALHGREGSPGALLRMTPVGAVRNVAPEPSGLLPGRTNYLIGRDPAAWTTNVPSFSGVRYRAVYPGVDLAFHGQGNEVEYDWVVSPGASADVIRMVFSGHENLRLDGDGNLVLVTTAGEVRQRRPTVYQEVAGGRRVVPGHFTLEDGGVVGFGIGEYDPSRPLVIDPLISFSTYLGGTNDDVANAMAVDGDGNVYLTGETRSWDFPTKDPFQAKNRDEIVTGRENQSDAFVTKINPAGELVYSTYLGGSTDPSIPYPSGDDFSFDVAVDDDGSVHITGYTYAADFPTTPTAFMPLQTQSDKDNRCKVGYVAEECGEVFVTKLTPNGAALEYSTYFGALGQDIGFGIDVDSTGKIYVTGSTRAENFPVTLGAYDLTCGGDGFCDQGANVPVPATPDPVPRLPIPQGDAKSFDAFVAEFDPGAVGALSLLYSTYLGGVGQDGGQDIMLDPAGLAVVTGGTVNQGFPSLAGTIGSTAAGGAFVSKFDLTAVGRASLVASTVIGTGDTYFNGLDGGGRALEVSGTGDVYLVGGTNADGLPTSFPLQAQRAGGWDAFVTKIDPTLSVLHYSTYLGGAGDDLPLAVQVDKLGNAYVAGYSSTSATDGRGVDVFVAVLNPAGSDISFFTYLGGEGDEDGEHVGGDRLGLGLGLVLDCAANLYVAGGTRAADYPVAGTFFSDESAGAQDAFVTKINAINPAAVLCGADLSVIKEVLPAETRPGEEVTYTITVTNEGSEPANAVKVTDLMPGTLVLRGAQASQGSCGEPSPAGLVCEIGGLDVGASATVTISAAATAVGEIVNQVIVASEIPDPDDLDNRASATLKVVDDIIGGPPEDPTNDTVPTDDGKTTGDDGAGSGDPGSGNRPPEQQAGPGAVDPGSPQAQAPANASQPSQAVEHGLSQPASQATPQAQAAPQAPAQAQPQSQAGVQAQSQPTPQLQSQPQAAVEQAAQAQPVTQMALQPQAVTQAQPGMMVERQREIEVERTGQGRGNARTLLASDRRQTLALAAVVASVSAVIALVGTATSSGPARRRTPRAPSGSGRHRGMSRTRLARHRRDGVVTMAKQLAPK